MDQYREMARRGFVVYSSKSIRERGHRASDAQALEFVADATSAVYVSLDIDVVDGSHASGAASKVFDGLTARELLQAMAIVSMHAKVQALDVLGPGTGRR